MSVIKKIVARLAAGFWSRNERLTLSHLRKEFACEPGSHSVHPLVVGVDGMLNIKFLSLFYILLLLVVQHKTKRRVEVVVFTARRLNSYFAALRIYKLFFKTHIVSADTLLNDEDSRLAEQLIQEIIAKAKNGNDIYYIFWGGVQIGRDIYNAILRDRLIGSLNGYDDRVGGMINLYVKNLFAAEALVNKFKPDFALMTDTGYAVFGPFFLGLLKNNVPTSIVVPYGADTGKVTGRTYASLKDWTEIDRRYPFSFTDATWQRLQEEYNVDKDQMVSEYLRKRFAGDDKAFDGSYHKTTLRYDRYDMLGRLGFALDANKKIVLIAAHLFWDEPGYEGLYKDYETWLRHTLKQVEFNSDVLWVLKAHPSEVHLGTCRYARDVVVELFGNNLPPHLKFVDCDADINTYSLIDCADVVITVRGTIAFEAACKGKYVVNAGFGPHTGLGFAKDFDSVAKYEDYLINLHREPTLLSAEQMRRARIGLFGYFVVKAPVAPTLLRGNTIDSYANLKGKELFADPTFNSIAEKISHRIEGDLVV